MQKIVTRIHTTFLWALLFLVLNASAAFAQLSLRLVPSLVELTLGRGGTKVFSFELSNENKEKTLSFTNFPLDVEVDRDGSVDFVPMDSVPYSCSQWITVEPSEITVEPGQAKKIIGKLSVPAAASAGGYLSAIVCELADKNQRRNAQGSIIRWRLACLVKVNVVGGKIEKKAAIEDFNLHTLFETEEEKNQGLKFVAAVKNKGNAHISAEGKLVILTPERTRKGEMSFNVGTGAILPGRTRDFVAVYDKLLSEGSYIARATFRYGGTASLEKEIPFTVSTAIRSGQTATGTDAVVLPLKAIPGALSLKIPAGGFRIAGVSLRNQTNESLRIIVSVDRATGAADWFQLKPEEIRIEGGREAKFLVHCTIPSGTKPGRNETRLILAPTRISADGKEEKLELQPIGINLEIPN